MKIYLYIYIYIFIDLLSYQYINLLMHYLLVVQLNDQYSRIRDMLERSPTRAVTNESVSSPPCGWLVRWCAKIYNRWGKYFSNNTCMFFALV